VIFQAISLSQPKILQRNPEPIPESYIKNFQNEYRKFINLNGEWHFSSTDPAINTNIQVPFCYDFKGKASVTRTFNVENENPAAYNYLIYCEGINYQCEISINGRFITKHEGGFTAFSSIIQEGIIKESGNEIEVKIDNSLDYSRTLPAKDQAWYPKNYGGIYRDIYIIAVPKLFIRNSILKSEIDINFSADVTNSVTISASDLSVFGGPSADKKFSVKTEIVDSAGNVKASSNETQFAMSENSTIQVENRLSVVSPQFWSPDYPYLYNIRVVLSSGTQQIDIYSTDFGIYEYSQKSNAVLFNRAEFKLKGINYIEEFAGSGIAASYQDIEKDIKNIKALGCNVIKVYGRPASPYLVHICNRYGLLILEELPLYNIPNGIIANENFTALAENQLNEMILNHKSNPCIFAYGLGNDFDVTDTKAKTFITRMVQVSKSLDIRPVFYSTRNFTNDICKDLVDFVGWNIYDKDLKIVKELITDPKFKKDKIFAANFGKIINPSNFSGYSDPSSIESQSKYIADFIKLTRNSILLGSFFTTYADWNADFPAMKFYDKGNQYLRTSGLYNLNREQRSSAIIFRKENLEEDIPNLNIGTFSREAPIVFVLLGLFTFILFIYLANSVRRFRENVWRALFRPFIFYSDVREQSLIPMFQNVLLALILSIGNALFFANLFYFWKDSQYFDIICSVIIPNDTLKSLFNDYNASAFKITLILTVVTFVKIFLISAVIWLFSLTSKFRIGFNNIYTVTVWGFLPTILLLLIGTFYIRLLYVNPDFVIIGLAVAGFIYLLSLYRILKGTYIIFDTFFLKVYSYGIATLLIVYGAIWIYMNETRFISDYFRLIFTFLKS
jgi:beta-galactosidase